MKIYFLSGFGMACRIDDMLVCCKEGSVQFHRGRRTLIYNKLAYRQCNVLGKNLIVNDFHTMKIYFISGFGMACLFDGVLVCCKEGLWFHCRRRFLICNKLAYRQYDIPYQILIRDESQWHENSFSIRVWRSMSY